MMKKYVTVELGGHPRVWANLRGTGCALMTRTSRQGVSVLGNGATEGIMLKLSELVATLEEGPPADMEEERAEPTTFLELGNPVRTLVWYPEATSARYVVLEWGPGADGSDGFLQLVERAEVMQWPALLREGLEQIEAAASEVLE